MPTFLTREQVYRMLQRELPDDVYPDGPPSAFFSTADMDSIADVAATGYTNLRQVYNNYFPQSCDSDAIVDWEIKAFGYQNDATLGLAERQQRVLTKLRTRIGLTQDDMKGIVLSIIGPDKIVEILNWGCEEGSWVLDFNQLGITTRLGSGPRLQAANPLACDMGPASFGLTEEQWAGIQMDAYTFAVMIYGYTLTANERAQIDRQLTIYEPARSTHRIYDGLDPGDQVFSPPTFLDGGNSDFAGPDTVDGGNSMFSGPDIIDGGDSF